MRLTQKSDASERCGQPDRRQTRGPVSGNPNPHSVASIPGRVGDESALGVECPHLCADGIRPVAMPGKGSGRPVDAPLRVADDGSPSGRRDGLEGVVAAGGSPAMFFLGMMLAVALGAADVCGYSIGIRNKPGDLACPSGLEAVCHPAGNPLPASAAQANLVSEAQLCAWAASLTVEQLGSQCSGSNQYLVWSGGGWACTPIWEEAQAGGVLGVVSLASGGSGSVVVRDNDPRMALAASSIQPGNPALTNSRTPTNHAATHASGGSDPLSGDFAITASAALTATTAETAGALDHSPDVCVAPEFALGIDSTGAAICDTPAGGSGPPFADLGIVSTGASQAAYQINDGAGNGIRIGSGQAGNAVTIEGMFTCDQNSNRCIVKDNTAIRWGDVNHDAYGGPVLRARHLDGVIKELGLDGMPVITPTAAPEDPCDGDHEGALWANGAQHTLCYCDGTSWSRAAGSLTGTCP